MRNTPWSDEEVQRLRLLYPNPNKSFEELLAEFPGRTANSLRLKASRLGLERPPILYGVYSEAVKKLIVARNCCDDIVIKEWIDEALDILEPDWRMDP